MQAKWYWWPAPLKNKTTEMPQQNLPLLLLLFDRNLCPIHSKVLTRCCCFPLPENEDSYSINSPPKMSSPVLFAPPFRPPTTSRLSNHRGRSLGYFYFVLLIAVSAETFHWVNRPCNQVKRRRRGVIHSLPVPLKSVGSRYKVCSRRDEAIPEPQKLFRRTNVVSCGFQIATGGGERGEQDEKP